MSAGEAGLAEANEQITHPTDTSGGESPLNVDVWSALSGFVTTEASPHTLHPATQRCIRQVLLTLCTDQHPLQHYHYLPRYDPDLFSAVFQQNSAKSIKEESSRLRGSARHLWCIWVAAICRRVMRPFCQFLCHHKLFWVLTTLAHLHQEFHGHCRTAIAICL